MIRVLIADDHKLAREAYQALLAREKDIEVVGQAHDGEQAVQLSRESVPQVVVMDIAMPGLNGLEATRQIRELPGNIQVLIISGVLGRTVVEAALDRGAQGFLAKHESFDGLVTAIRAVNAGKRYYSPAVADMLADLREWA